MTMIMTMMTKRAVVTYNDDKTKPKKKLNSVSNLNWIKETPF